MIRAILATDDVWGIGKNNELPWPHNSEDLKWFKKLTDGHTIAMGRNTWESLPFKPLPNRKNIVISSKGHLDADQSISIEGFKAAVNVDLNDVWIIGGATLIKEMLPYIDEIHLSKINGNFNCDVHLPEDDIKSNFNRTEISHDFLNLERWDRK